MVDYIKLKKEDFLPEKGGSRNREPQIVIRSSGLFVLNRATINLLDLMATSEYTGVAFCAEKSSRNCFAIMSDNSPDAYVLRELKCGQKCFNNHKLAQHIIEATLQRKPVVVGSVPPKSITFRVASKPIDDDKNSDVFALIQKK